jgi:EAL domain-containing protein (putative c-di-GMP-specific phosphodiesterase class I)
MYTAKQRARGRVVTFERSMTVAPARRRLVESALHDALAENRFSLQFQPIVRAVDRSTVMFEALARWNDPQLGSIAPAEFIPIAERNGDVVAIGRWALETACRAAMTWQTDRAPAVAVNVSIAQIIAGSLLNDVKSALDVSGLDPRRLHVEVTESLFAAERNHTIDVLRAVRGLGVSVSLDDFGTGYSSMGYLGSLPIDALKIDQTFIARLDGEGRPIIEAIHSLSRAFELDVIAEGVESELQFEELRALGVPLVQGYWISRPLPGDRVQAFLDDAPAFVERPAVTTGT